VRCRLRKGSTAVKLETFVQELANESIKAETAAIDKANLFAAQGAGETEVRSILVSVLIDILLRPRFGQAETTAFKCGKCGQSKARYYQMQTRSADEPMTVSTLRLKHESLILIARTLCLRPLSRTQFLTRLRRRSDLY